MSSCGVKVSKALNDLHWPLSSSRAKLKLSQSVWGHFVAHIESSRHLKLLAFLDIPEAREFMNLGLEKKKLVALNSSQV